MDIEKTHYKINQDENHDFHPDLVEKKEASDPLEVLKTIQKRLASGECSTRDELNQLKSISNDICIRYKDKESRLEGIDLIFRKIFNKETKLNTLNEKIQLVLPKDLTKEKLDEYPLEKLIPLIKANPAHKLVIQGHYIERATAFGFKGDNFSDAKAYVRKLFKKVDFLFDQITRWKWCKSSVKVHGTVPKGLSEVAYDTLFSLYYEMFDMALRTGCKKEETLKDWQKIKQTDLLQLMASSGFYSNSRIAKKFLKMLDKINPESTNLTSENSKFAKSALKQAILHRKIDFIERLKKVARIEEVLQEFTTRQLISLVDEEQALKEMKGVENIGKEVIIERARKNGCEKANLKDSIEYLLKNKLMVP